MLTSTPIRPLIRLTALVREFDLSVAHEAMRLHNGKTVKHNDAFGSITGTLTVSEMYEDGRRGFTYSVVTPGGTSFLGSGVWEDDACGIRASGIWIEVIG